MRWLGPSVAAMIACSPFAVEACFVCVADPLETVLVANLETAGQVVIASPVGDPSDAVYEVVTVYRGEPQIAVNDRITATLPMFSDDAGKVGRGDVLITRAGEGQDWLIRSPAEKEHVGFIESVLQLPQADSQDLLDQINRALFFASHLHAEDALLARAAAAELTRVPYPVLKKIRSRLDPVAIRKALRDPAYADRFALFYTLLGVCGNADDAKNVRNIVENMWKGNSWRNLGGVLTAMLELHGEAAVAVLEEYYLKDPNRTLPEVEQAILALRVHGDTNDRIPRSRVLQSLRLMMEVREPLVFLIVPDLARWEEWAPKKRLQDLAKRRGSDIPELRQQVDQYLVQCPK
jgi:hypothetical protein